MDASLERADHRPRADHDLLHPDAGDDGGLWQLVRAADDRRSGHGLPAHEQHQFLAAGPVIPAAPRLDLRVGRHWPRGRYGLDALRAALDLRLLGARGRYGHLFDPPRRRELDPRRDQLHHHHPQHARAGNGVAQDAPVRMVGARHRLHAPVLTAGARGRDHHASDRP